MKKRWAAAVLAVVLAVFLAACTGKTGSSSLSTGETACGTAYASVEEALLDRSYDADGCDIVTGTLGSDVVSRRELGDVRTFRVANTVWGTVASEICLAQMTDAPRLVAGREYLLLLAGRDTDMENEYEVVGEGSQCAFWLENGKLCGNDADLVEEINADTANGIRTMEDLEDYFAARMAALK